MPRQIKINRRESEQIDRLVNLYSERIEVHKLFLEGLHSVFKEHSALSGLLHSTRMRLKSEHSLRNKLERKLLDAKSHGTSWAINKSNLFDAVQDLAGIRLLHLHTSQTKSINEAIFSIIHEQNYELVEGPIANTWDDDYSELFQRIGIDVRRRSSMYTSVHYVIASNNRDRTRCEVQVRTLLEEVWGEVSHKLNYPEESKCKSCREQLKVLARVTSSGTRLVDTIFLTDTEFNEHK